MLGRHSPQGELFRPDNIHMDHVGRDSLYGFLAQERHRLFRDEDFADLYKKDWGRPSVPPSQLCIALVLQAKDGVSDDEAIQRSAFDLRWKVALGIDAQQRTSDFKRSYRRRTRVEHRIARLIQLGGRQARYLGRAKVAYQVCMTAAVANLMVAMGAVSRALRGPGDALRSLLAVSVAQLIAFSRAVTRARELAAGDCQVGRQRRFRVGMPLLGRASSNEWRGQREPACEPAATSQRHQQAKRALPIASGCGGDGPASPTSSRPSRTSCRHA